MKRFRLFLRSERLYPNQRSWVLELSAGNGAGYVGGWAIWLGWRVKDYGRPAHTFNRLVSFGFTRRARCIVPQGSGLWKHKVLVSVGKVA